MTESINLIWSLFVFFYSYKLIFIFITQEYFKKFSKNKADRQPFISIIVPARNEENNISNCVQSFLNQNYPKNKYEIIVVNDNSTDKTAEIVQEFCNKFNNIKLINAPVLPENWTGKNHASYLGYLNAQGEYLCFIDADVTAVNNNILQKSINFALFEQTDLFSLSPMQTVVSIEEQLLLPGIFLAIAGDLNIRLINSSNKKYAVASGQFLMFKRSSYEQIGTHLAIKNIINDDLTWARIIKANNLKLNFSLAKKDQLLARMYTNTDTIIKGFIKNLADMIAPTYQKLVLEIFFISTISFGAYFVPISLFLFDLPNSIFLTSIISSISFWLIIISSSLQLRSSPLIIIWTPLSFFIYLILLYKSFIIKNENRKIIWKDRIY